MILIPLKRALTQFSLATFVWMCAVSGVNGAHAAQIILVGDSTMASETGYGDALCQRLRSSAGCFNMAKGGRSSSSYRAEGSWSEVLARLRAANSNQPTYVLIQFGHNDQPGKPGRSTDLRTEFPVNLRNYVREVKSLGAVPVLVTPLVRREFQGDTLKNNLLDWANATRQVARSENVALLDLNADSYQLVQNVGQSQADSLAMAAPPAIDQTVTASTPKDQHYRGFDRTHLGAKGARLFSGVVAQELIDQFPVLATEFVDEKVKR